MAKGNEIMLYLAADNNELKAKLSEAQKSLEKMKEKTQSNSQGMIASFKEVGAAIATYFAIGAVKDFAKFTGEVETVKNTFTAMTASFGKDGEILLNSVKKATQGTIDNLDIMKTSNLAMGLLGKEVIDKLPEMATIAMAAARLQGQNVNQMFNDIVTATGRKSVLILDNLGISSSIAAKHMETYARTLGTTRDKLTSTQESAAFFYAVMQAGRETMKRVDISTLTLGEKIQILTANMSNSHEEMAKGFLPGLNNLVGTLADATTNAGGFSARIGRLGSYMALFLSEVILQVQLIKTAFEMFPLKVEIAFYKIKNPIISVFADIALSMSKLFSGLPGIGEALSEKFMGYYRDVQNELKAEPFVIGMDKLALTQLGVQFDEYQKKIEGTRRISTELWNGTYKGTQDGKRSFAEFNNELTDQNNKLGNLKNTWSEYYAFIGDKRNEELAKLQEQQEQLLKTNIPAMQNQLMVEEAYQKQRLKIIKKYDNQVSTEMKNTAIEIANSFDQALTGTVKNALSETLQGKNGFKDFGRQVGKIFADLIADLIVMMIRAAALRAIMAGMSGGESEAGTGAASLGGILKLALFEKGRLPVLEGGRMPVLQSGYVPADHFAAYIGTKEAVLDAETTRANYPIIQAMFANKGQSIAAGNTTQIFNVSGNLLSRDYVERDLLTQLKDIARREGGQLFYKEGYRR